VDHTKYMLNWTKTEDQKKVT